MTGWQNEKSLVLKSLIDIEGSIKDLRKEVKDLRDRQIKTEVTQKYMSALISFSVSAAFSVAMKIL